MTKVSELITKALAREAAKKQRVTVKVLDRSTSQKGEAVHRATIAWALYKAVGVAKRHVRDRGKNGSLI